MFSSRIIGILGLAVLSVALPACQRKPSVEPTLPPAEVPARPVDAPASPAAGRAPSPPPAPMNESTEEVLRTPPQLQAAYLAAKEFPDKVEIIYDLGDLDTTDAIYTLMRLFETESDPDLKQEMIDATERMEEQLPAKLAFLTVALWASQPPDIRDTAVGLLLTIEDRRAIPVWQQLLRDSDPDRREMAQQRIEDLQQLEPN